MAAGMVGERRLEGILNRTDSQRGKTRPTRWKKSNGVAVTDWRIAKLWLQGTRMRQIAQRTGLGLTTVYFRLRRMGFPKGQAAAYLHGERVTAQHFLSLCTDLGLSKRKLAQLVGLSESWTYKRIRAHKAGTPLSLALAKRFTVVRSMLVEKYRETSTTPRGGRPSKLLPSDRSGLPRRYKVLLGDLNLLRNWLLGREKRPLYEEMWAWLCEQSRLGRLQTLFSWPAFFEWVRKDYQVGAFLEGDWVPHSLALDFLAESHAVSTETVRRAVLTT